MQSGFFLFHSILLDHSKYEGQENLFRLIGRETKLTKTQHLVL